MHILKKGGKEGRYVGRLLTKFRWVIKVVTEANIKYVMKRKQVEARTSVFYRDEKLSCEEEPKEDTNKCTNFTLY